MVAAAVFDAASSNPSPNLMDDAALPCFPDDEIAAAAVVAVAVLLDYFAYSNRSVRTISCARDRAANDQWIPSDEYYGEVTLLAFHRLSVAMDARNCNERTNPKKLKRKTKWKRKKKCRKRSSRSIQIL